MAVTTEAAVAADANEDNGAGEQPATGLDAEEGGVTPEEIESVLGKTGRSIKTTGTGPKAAAAEPPAPPEEDEQEEEAAGADDPKVRPVQPQTPPEQQPKPPTEPRAPEPPAAEEREFTIEVEDAQGNKHKISRVEDLPEDFEPKSNRQGLEIVSSLVKLDAEKEAYEKEQADQKASADRDARVASIREGWDQEFKELGVATKADQDKVMEYMREENAKRESENRPLIASVEDAKNGMDARDSRVAAEEAAKAEKEEARRKGALIGGGATGGGGGATPVYKGGARNAVAAAKAMNLF